MADQETLALGRELGLQGKELHDFLRDERTKRREEAQFQWELQQKEIEVKREDDERAHERALQLLEVEKQLEEMRLEANRSRQTEPGSGSVPTQLFQKVMPPFDETKDDMDAYMLRFERLATARKWPEEDWASALSLYLTGEALEIYARLPPADSVNYAKLKEALLLRFRLTEDGFRERFRLSVSKDGETATQFLARLTAYLERWVELGKINKEYEALRDLFVKEQFISQCETGLARFLKERTYPTIEELGTAADRYIEAQGFSQVGGKKRNDKGPTKPAGSGNQGQGQKVDQRLGPQNPILCFLCNKGGHKAADCWKSAKKITTCFKCGKLGHKAVECRTSGQRGNTNRYQVGGNGDRTPTKSYAEASAIKCLYTDEGEQIDVVITTLQKPNELFIMPGMPVVKGIINRREGTVLRDSGCNTVIVRGSFVRPKQMTGQRKAIYFLDHGVKILPEAELPINTPYFQGTVRALVMENPLYDLTLGNIPGVRGAENPDREWKHPGVRFQSDILTETKEVSSNSEDREAEARERLDPEIVCNVLTRAQAAKEKSETKTTPLKVMKLGIADVRPENLGEEQKRDSTLNKCFDKIGQSWEQGKWETQYEYILRDNILYRKKVTRKALQETLQLVVPKKFRNGVMQLAHDNIMAAHLGRKKTQERIESEFFWPGLTADVSRYVRSCDICQRTVPKGLTPRVPLGKMPLIETPFKRVAVDLIGPLQPRSERGHSYVLTLVDYATRYPEAVALRKIDSEAVAEALLEIFSRVGVPEEILHDQGSQFVSGVMREVCRLLSMKQITTTAYHPMCNGLVEKFNGTLKTMIKRLAAERPKDWDRFLAPAMFAYREVPQESTSFSPFELLYGRHVRGPMTILKELWTGKTDEETKLLYQYVIELRDRLEQTCQLAHEELKKSTGIHKAYYDKKSKERQFTVGDQVLLLLPTDNNKLIMQWKGPFRVVEKLNELDYRIQIGTHVKTFHANLLKRYEERKEDTNGEGEKLQINTILLREDPCYQDSDDYLIPSLLNHEETVGDVVIETSLSAQQQTELRDLLKEFSDVFVNVPGHTTLETCHLKLRTEQPLTTKQYPLPYAVKEEVEKEVKSMLEMGIIEKSESPYNSPVLLVRKPDGTHRLCIDFRNLNRITEVSAEPMPRPDNIYDQLKGECYFSKLDLTKGYWQIPLSEDSREKTAFSTATGHYHFKYLPFGINQAPAVFTRLMRKVLTGVEHVDNYLDDCLIHTQTWEEHLAAIRGICERLRRAGLTARPTKCVFGKSEIEFLGHKISKGILRPTDTLISKIDKADTPKTKKQLRAFLGLAGFYRNFIPNFATISAPLTDLTKKGTSNKIPWSAKANEAFLTMKKMLIADPVLRLPDFERTFILRTDASNTGLGAVLLQEDSEGFLHPIAYASRKLLPREAAYSTLEKECLAIVWALGKFHIYLYGRQFFIQTDHQPLSCLQQSDPKNSRLKRWAILLQEYQFVIKTIKGTDNVGADY